LTSGLSRCAATRISTPFSWQFSAEGSRDFTTLDGFNAIILPGIKNTAKSLGHLRQTGIAAPPHSHEVRSCFK
jgi:cobyric acid synthase